MGVAHPRTAFGKVAFKFSGGKFNKIRLPGRSPVDNLFRSPGFSAVGGESDSDSVVFALAGFFPVCLVVPERGNNCKTTVSQEESLRVGAILGRRTLQSVCDGAGAEQDFLFRPVREIVAEGIIYTGIVYRSPDSVVALPQKYPF